MRRENLLSHVAGIVICVAVMTALVVGAFATGAASAPYYPSDKELPDAIEIGPMEKSTGIINKQSYWPHWSQGPFISLWIDNDRDGINESIDTYVRGPGPWSKMCIQIQADKAGKVIAVYVVDRSKYSIDRDAWNGEPWILVRVNSNVIGMNIRDVDMNEWKYGDREGHTALVGFFPCIHQIDTPDVMIIGKELTIMGRKVTFRPRTTDGGVTPFWFVAIYFARVMGGPVDTIAVRMEAWEPVEDGAEDKLRTLKSKTVIRIMDLDHDGNADVAYAQICSHDNKDSTVEGAFADGLWPLSRCDFSTEGEPIVEIDVFDTTYTCRRDPGI